MTRRFLSVLGRFPQIFADPTCLITRHLPVPDLIVLIEDFRHVGPPDHLRTSYAVVTGNTTLTEIILHHVDLNALLLQLGKIFIWIRGTFY